MYSQLRPVIVIIKNCYYCVAVSLSFGSTVVMVVRYCGRCNEPTTAVPLLTSASQCRRPLCRPVYGTKQLTDIVHRI